MIRSSHKTLVKIRNKNETKILVVYLNWKKYKMLIFFSLNSLLKIKHQIAQMVNSNNKNNG